MNHWTYNPRPASRTSRKLAKTKIRNGLGTNGDGAPSARRTLQAASQMAELVHLATDGRLQLNLTDLHTGQPVDWLTAIGAANTDPEA